MRAEASVIRPHSLYPLSYGEARPAAAPRYPHAREWEVLALVREGLSNEKIAERLDITERTARFHVSEILGKLGVSTRQEAAAWQPEERRQWWALAFAPFSFGRAHRWLATAAVGTTIAVGVAGVAVLL